MDIKRDSRVSLSLCIHAVRLRAARLFRRNEFSRQWRGAGEKMMTKRSRGGGERDRRGGGNRFVSVFLVYVCDACIYTVLIVGSLLRFVWLYIYIYIYTRPLISRALALSIIPRRALLRGSASIAILRARVMAKAVIIAIGREWEDYHHDRRSCS